MAGLPVRTHLTHLPLPEDELPDIFHLAAEGHLDPPQSSVQSRQQMALCLPLQLMWTPKLQPASQPASVSSNTEVSLNTSFLDDLPSLSPEVREDLEMPLILAELETVVDSTSQLDWSLSF